MPILSDMTPGLGGHGAVMVKDGVNKVTAAQSNVPMGTPQWSCDLCGTISCQGESRAVREINWLSLNRPDQEEYSLL
jgi:hypothetical protein